MAHLTKNRAANELRAKADELRAKLADPAVELTKDEMEKLAEGIRTYEARANMVAGFTPEEEIERAPEGDPVKRIANPDATEKQEARTLREQYEERSLAVRRAFGGSGGYLLALAKEQAGKTRFTAEQQRAHTELQALAGKLDLEQRTIVGTASDASGGEFLLPLQQESSIFQVDVIQPGLLETATRFPVAGRSLRIPFVEQTDGDVTSPLSGIATVGIVAENGEFGQREPKFDQRVLTVFKWGAYSEIGDETLADDFTGDLAPTVQRLVGGDIVNQINKHVTRSGTGSNQPLGAFHTNNPALIKVEREVASEINVGDVFSMYAKHTMTGGGRSRWYVSRSALPQLLALKLDGNTLVTWLPSLNGAPTMQLLGLPVVICDMMATLGTEADLALGNGAFYAAAIRQELTTESSIHYKFRNGVTAYRFYARAGGIPIPTGTYAFESAASTKLNEHSPFVVLDDVVAS